MRGIIAYIKKRNILLVNNYYLYLNILSTNLTSGSSAVQPEVSHIETTQVPFMLHRFTFPSCSFLWRNSHGKQNHGFCYFVCNTQSGILCKEGVCLFLHNRPMHLVLHHNRPGRKMGRPVIPSLTN